MKFIVSAAFSALLLASQPVSAKLATSSDVSVRPVDTTLLAMKLDGRRQSGNVEDRRGSYKGNRDGSTMTNGERAEKNRRDREQRSGRGGGGGGGGGGW